MNISRYVAALLWEIEKNDNNKVVDAWMWNIFRMKYLEEIRPRRQRNLWGLLSGDPGGNSERFCARKWLAGCFAHFGHINELVLRMKENKFYFFTLHLYRIKNAVFMLRPLAVTFSSTTYTFTLQLIDLSKIVYKVHNLTQVGTLRWNTKQPFRGQSRLFEVVGYIINHSC